MSDEIRLETERVGAERTNTDRGGRALRRVITAALAFATGLAELASADANHAASAASASAKAGESARAITEEQIAESEYRPRWTPQGLQAPNRAQGLRTWFQPTGAAIEARSGASEQRFELSLARIGRGGSLAAVPAGRVEPSGDRVRIVRPGVVEWFENGPAGVEHGFDLAARPAGEGELALELRVTGAKVEPRAQGVALVTQSGRRFRYDSLHVVDADGQVLASRMQAAGESGIRLLVRDGAANYPLTIDPLLQADFQLEGNQAEAHFGFSMASGDIDNDGFDDLVASAPVYDAGVFDEGAVFVFHGSASGLVGTNPSGARTIIRGAQERGNLGFRVLAADVNGDNFDDVIASSVAYNRGLPLEGAVFVFHGSASGIANTTAPAANSILESDQQQSYFGNSIAVGALGGQDTLPDLVVGARFYDRGQVNEGAVFVFNGSATGIPSGSANAATATLESNLANASFGASVAILRRINNDAFADLAIGAPFFVSRLIPANTRVPNPNLPPGQTSLLGNVTETQEGAVFVFQGAQAVTSFNNATPTNATATLQGNANGSLVGESVASAGDVNDDGFTDLIFSAHHGELRSPGLTTANVEGDEGNAYVFHGRASGLPSNTINIQQPSTWDATGWLPSIASSTLDSNLFQVDFGSVVAGVGDLNGDGFDDVAVGARYVGRALADPPFEGQLFGFFGSASGVAPPASQVSRPVNFPATSQGTVTISGAIFGLAGRTAANADFTAEANQTFANLGEAVTAGDFNGDGARDLVYSSHYFNAGQANEGVAFVVMGEGGGGSGGSGGGAELSDLDADGVADALDNCIFAANAAQFDADGDGCGNRCDADLDQSGKVTITDVGAFSRCYGRVVPVSDGPRLDPSCEESDFNQSGAVTPADLAILRRAIGEAPGPGAGCR